MRGVVGWIGLSVINPAHTHTDTHKMYTGCVVGWFGLSAINPPDTHSYRSTHVDGMCGGMVWVIRD